MGNRHLDSFVLRHLRLDAPIKPAGRAGAEGEGKMAGSLPHEFDSLICPLLFGSVLPLSTRHAMCGFRHMLAPVLQTGSLKRY